MNDMEFECGEELETEEVTIDRVPADYRDPKINQVTFLLVAAVIVATTWLPTEELYRAVAVAVGLLLSGIIIAVSEKCIRQWTVADLESGEVYRYTECFGRSWSRNLVSLDLVTTIFVNPKPNMWSENLELVYPISLATSDGREIPFCNSADCRSLNSSAPWALTFGEFMGKEVYIGNDDLPMAVRNGGQLLPKNEDVGMFGRYFLFSILGFLLWGMASLMLSPTVEEADTVSASDLHNMAVLAANIEQQPVPESPVKTSKTTPPSTPAKAAEKK